ncbi:hypothetical protein D0A24_21855 [Salmonella enterica]|nr:hypothetical protein [Salmonella enterica]
MEGVIRGLVCLSLTGFIQAQRFQHDNGKFFICTKMRQRSHFSVRPENKNLAEKSEVFTARCGW